MEMVLLRWLAIVVLMLLLLVGVAVHGLVVSAGAVRLLTPSIGHGPWSVSAFLDQRLVVLSSGSRMNGAPALVAIVLQYGDKNHFLYFIMK